LVHLGEERDCEDIVSCPRTQPGLEPRLLDPESNALAFRQLDLHSFNFQRTYSPALEKEQKGASSPSECPSQAQTHCCSCPFMCMYVDGGGGHRRLIDSVDL